MIITLCGSTRFKKEYVYWNSVLTACRFVVFSVAMWSHGDRKDPSFELKTILDSIHLAKIKESKAIFVIDQELVPVGENYIGSSTRAEIEFARTIGLEVFFASRHGAEFRKKCMFLGELHEALGITTE